MKNRMIKNYNPNRAMAKRLMWKRIKYFSYFMLAILILEVIAYILIWKLDSKDSVKYAGIVIISLHILSTITFFWIYDFGAAEKLKKSNFKDVSKNHTLEQGHTFYAALRYIGIVRFIINNFFILMNLIVILLAFWI